MTVNETLHSLGITRNYRGCKQMSIAVELVCENPDRLNHITKDVYCVVANKCGCSALCVERNIRTIILKVWKNHSSRLCDIAGYQLIIPPTVAEFIDIVAMYVTVK